MTDEKQPDLEADEWLDDLTGEGEKAGFDEIDQASIDQLLDNSDTEDIQKADQEDGQEPFQEAEQLAAEKESGSTGNDPGEIDQAALDVLLNDDDSGESYDPPAMDLGAADAGASLDQASIDSLLESDDNDFQAALEDTTNVPSQTDIDELFAQAQNERTKVSDDHLDPDGFFAEGLQSGTQASRNDQPGNSAGWNLDPFATLQEEPPLEEDIFGEEIIETPGATTGGMPWQKFMPRRFLTGASRRSLWGVLLAAVLLLGGGFSYIALRHHSLEEKGSPPVMVPPSSAETPTVATTHKANRPIVADRLPEADKPSLAEESSKYQVTDAKEFSKPATTLVTGPDSQPKAETEQPGAPRLLKPQRPVLQASDITLKTLSTRKLMIGWREIWQQANGRPFSPKVRVEILGKDLRGELTAIGHRKHCYRPDRLFSGSESIRYRFREGKAASKIAELRLLVVRGDFPPEIRFRSPLEKSYLVGETVVLDASPTVDDDPATLSFTWEQVAGTPVKLERLNERGSMVSFVVPSSFYTEKDPGPVLQLTATDHSGQKDQKMLKITSRSRRHSPLWEVATLDACL
ncbi:MAG: hypothetical protein P8Y63_05665 [Deltaproteobacteria bacterium]